MHYGYGSLSLLLLERVPVGQVLLVVLPLAIGGRAGEPARPAAVVTHGPLVNEVVACAPALEFVIEFCFK